MPIRKTTYRKNKKDYYTFDHDVWYYKNRWKKTNKSPLLVGTIIITSSLSNLSSNSLLEIKQKGTLVDEKFYLLLQQRRYMLIQLHQISKSIKTVYSEEIKEN